MEEESASTVHDARGVGAEVPNVVLIVLDDLGFAQLGCYGSDVATPRIDALAAHGLRYNNFHVTSLCSPTRACLLTGRNHHAVGMGFLTDIPMTLPGYTSRIPKSAVTLPRLLRDAGYNTLGVGKWHLTPRTESGPTGPFERWPLAMGFERYYGFLRSNTSQWTPDLVRDNGFVEPPRSPTEGYHLTEDLADQAIHLVQEQKQTSPDKPFFLYFATGAVHSPQQVPSTWVEPYRDRFNDGWEAWRHRAFQRQQELGVVPAGARNTDRPPWVGAWDDLTAGERRLFARQMEVFAGFLSHTDDQIGRLIDFLSLIGVLDHTMVMVVSDNGASADGGPNGFFIRQEKDDVEYMMERIDELGGFRSYNHYAWAWAWAGNAPFRLWKHYTWLGGVRTPLIVHWPTGIARETGGEVRGQFCHAVDIMPTILDVTGLQIPEVIDGVEQQPLDGRSIVKTFGDAAHPAPRSTQYFEMMGSRAIYHDGWKATTHHVDSPLRTEREAVEGTHDFDADQWSLFCLDTDFSEAHDLAEEHPDRLTPMIDLWWTEARRNNVLPLMNHEDRLAAMEPVPDHAGRRFVYLPGEIPIVTPSPFATGFRVTAEIEVPGDRQVAGIICSQGDWTNAAWACYVLDGRLFVTFNFGDNPQRIAVREAVPAGQHALGIVYIPGPDGAGSITITVDGRTVGEGLISADLTYQARLGFVGNLLIGRDHGFPVSDDYQPPFPFTGRIDRVIFEILHSSARMGFSEEITSALNDD